MAFLGSIGKAIGIGDLTHQPFKAATRIAATAGGYALGGAPGAALGNALGTVAVGDQNGSHSLLSAGINGLKAYGITSGGQALYDKAGSLLPSSTAQVASSGSQLALNPELIDQAATGAAGAGGAAAGGVEGATAGGLTDVGLNSQLAGLGTGAGAGGAAAGSGAANAATAAAGYHLPTSIGDALGQGKNFLANNGRNIATLAPVALSAMQGSGQSAEEKALSGQAGRLDAQGQELMASLQSGKLPAGMQSYYDQALQDATTAIRSKYASMGLSGSTMESQEIAAAQQRVAGVQAQQIQTMMEQGLQLTNSSSDLYKQIMQSNMQKDQDLSSAIANAVGSMGGYQQPTATQ